MLRLSALLLPLLLMLAAAGLALLARGSRRRPDAGGSPPRILSGCPATPNCVCSEAGGDHAHRIAPLALPGPPAEGWQRLRETVGRLPRTRIVLDTGSYLHAEVSSALFRFVDDLELRLDESGCVIHVRSAARAGRSDFGVNRRRVERLRAALSVPSVE